MTRKSKWDRFKNDKIKIVLPNSTQPQAVTEIKTKLPISIIITAYNSEDYIEECLDSINNQTYFDSFNEYEILVGVDFCEKTLEKLLSIEDKYPNLKIAMMSSNEGTYVTTNTLLELAKFENIIRFDSDDIMLPNLVSKVMENANDYDVIRFKYVHHDGKLCYPNGTIFYNKKIFNKLLGYQPWRFTADAELLWRINHSNFKVLNINEPLFTYRKHNRSLTQTVPQNKRLEYHKLFGKINLTERITNNFELKGKSANNTNDNQIIEDLIPDKNLDILIVNLNGLELTKNCVSDLLNQINQNFTLTIVDQNSTELGTKEYLESLKEYGIKIIYNSENVDLNRIWNDFYLNTTNEYLCYLNNDIRLTNNFVDDTIKILDKEDKVGSVIHVTNNPKFVSPIFDLTYEILSPPLYQGWDFTIRRTAFELIPETLRIFGGDDFIFASLKNKGFLIALCYSSPIIHFKEQTRNKFGDEIHKIQSLDAINYNNEIKTRNLTHTNSTIFTDKCNKFPPKGMLLTQNKNCVYTTIIGDYDGLPKINGGKKNGWDYICFTDNKNISSSQWKVVYIKNPNHSNIYNLKLSRLFKTNFFKYLLSYDNLIYIDARIDIISDIDKYLGFLGDNDIQFVIHPQAKSIKDEMGRVLLGNLERKDNIDILKKKYESEAYKYDNGLFIGGVLLYKNNEITRSFFKEWWNNINSFSNRDQLTLNYSLWKTKEIKYKKNGWGEIIGKYFSQRKRKQKRVTYGK